MAVCADTNLPIRLYAEMPDSEEVARRLGGWRRGARNRLAIAWLHQVDANQVAALGGWRRGEGLAPAGGPILKCPGGCL